MRIFFYILFAHLILVQCGQQSQKELSPNITITPFSYGSFPDTGEKVEGYTLTNSNGMEIDIIAYGGIITRWTAPDRDGNYKDIVLGYNNLEQYLAINPYFGALIGRYGNRIAGARFTIDDREYTLAANNGPNHLHGGNKGFDKVLWNSSPDESTGSLVLTYESPDMEEGYPGNLLTTVTYTLTEDDELQIAYKATSDKETIVNLTQHTYFNLSGDFTQEILDHELSLYADSYLPVDSTLIPLDKPEAVEGGPFDFRTSKTIGRDINADHPQLKIGNGYDHCWILNDYNENPRLVATVYHAGSGRYMEVITTEPGIQLYTGNFLDGSLPTKEAGTTYGVHTGFCLETQHFPDSPNRPEFPSVLLKPGEVYSSYTAYKFSVR